MVIAKVPQYINSWDGVLDWLRGKNSAAEILALSDGEHVEIKCTAPSNYPFASGSLSAPCSAFCVVPADEVPPKILEKLKRGEEEVSPKIPEELKRGEKLYMSQITLALFTVLQTGWSNITDDVRAEL